MTATFESLMRLDRWLAAAGQHPLAPFWQGEARRLYEHPTASVYAAEAGRGSAKSFFGSRVGLNETINGDFEVPAGECHFWIDVSENKSEAAQRLRQYREWLDILGVTFEDRGDEIVIPELRRGFLVRAAQVGRLSGFRAFGLRIDEAAKLPWDDDSANPLSELWASGTAMMITHLRHRPKRLLLSSPVGVVGFFNELVRQGDTADQVVAQNVPTWVANPSVTEEQTRTLERDPDVWRREYAAIPSASESTAFVTSDVPPCFELRRERYIRREPVLACDPASSGNTFAYLVAQWCDPDPEIEYQRLAPPPGSGLSPDTFIGWRLDQHGQRIPLPRATRPVLYISEIGGWTGEELRETTMDRVASELAWIARSHGAKIAFTDSFGDAFLAALLSQHGLRTRSFHQSQPSKHEAVMFLRSLMRDRQLVICEHEGMRRDLLTYPRRITGSGFSYGTRRAGHHWDYASALVILAHSMTTEHVGTPTDQQSYRIDGAITRRAIGGRQALPGR